MTDIMKDYTNRINELRKQIRAKKTFEPAMELALEIHAVTHTSAVSNSPTPTFYDDVLKGLMDEDFSVMPTEKDETIAWHIWHIARIEDLVGNLLIAELPQILNEAWMKGLNTSVKDTGNAMTDDEIMTFSKQVNTRELINYRDAVGRQTRKILQALTPDDLKRKPKAGCLERLVEEGGLLSCKDSLWLKDFWGKHTVAGLILLPLTRHHMMHLPDSMAIKTFIKNEGTPFMA